MKQILKDIDQTAHFFAFLFAMCTFMVFMTGLLPEIFSNNASLPGYFFCFLLYGLGLAYLFSTRSRISIPKKGTFIPLLFVGIWVYGLFLGCFLENKPTYILRNFFGMSVYGLYFIFITNKSFNKTLIIKTIVFSAQISVFYSILSALYLCWEDGKPFFSRYYFYGSMPLYFITFSVGIASLFYRCKNIDAPYQFFLQSKKMALFWIVLSLLAILFSASKGMLLGLICLSFSLFFLISQPRKSQFSFLLYAFYFLLFGILVFSVFEFSGIFSIESSGNATRYMMIKTLLDNAAWLGNGLGSIPEQAIGNRTYGYELSFLNLIDKFGIFSLPLFFCYIYTVILIFKKFALDPYPSLLALSCMCYLAVSIGNPTLFAPVSVLLHLLALLLILKPA